MDAHSRSWAHKTAQKIRTDFSFFTWKVSFFLTFHLAWLYLSQGSSMRIVDEKTFRLRLCRVWTREMRAGILQAMDVTVRERGGKIPFFSDFSYKIVGFWKLFVQAWVFIFGSFDFSFPFNFHPQFPDLFSSVSLFFLSETLTKGNKTAST